MNPLDQEEVPSKAPAGQMLFIGVPIEDSVVLAAGSAAFLVEPYYVTPEIFAGRQSFVKFYRRLYEGDTVEQGQVLGMIEPAIAIGTVREKVAKIQYALAEHIASVAGEEEGKQQHDRALTLYAKKALPLEDLGGARLTWLKLVSEQKTKFESIELARTEKDKADTELRNYEIRATLPYKHLTIKSISRQAGYFVKQLEPTVLTVQSIERLQAEALIELQYYTRLKDRKNITATIEPTLLEAPHRELPAHDAEITCVAVSKDMKFISGSEDASVRVWSPDVSASLLQWDHDAPVKVVACTPPACEKNICLVGCTSGSIYLWNLDDPKAELVRLGKDKAHGHDAAITALAFSGDGKFFATGASDGTIRMWATWTGDGDKLEYAKLQYAFTPEHGVAHTHDDAVTSLSFTPQCRLISAGRDKKLCVWQLKEKGAAQEGKAISREGTIAHLGVSSDGKWMLNDQGRMLKLLSVEKENHPLVHTISVAPNATPFDHLAIFSPDGSLILTAGAPEGRMQLWRTPDAKTRGYEVRQFATRECLPVSCAAFSPLVAGKESFAVSGSGKSLYIWSIPTPAEVEDHPIRGVPMTLMNQTLDSGTNTGRVGFHVDNLISDRYPKGRFEAGRPVTIVIE